MGEPRTQEQIEVWRRGYLRHEIARRINPRQWQELYQRGLATGARFDDLIDEWGSRVIRANNVQYR